MAAGDRNKRGKSIDIVRHYRLNDLPICKQKKWGYATNDINDVTCKICKKILSKSNYK